MKKIKNIDSVATAVAPFLGFYFFAKATDPFSPGVLVSAAVASVAAFVLTMAFKNKCSVENHTFSFQLLACLFLGAMADYVLLHYLFVFEKWNEWFVVVSVTFFLSIVLTFAMDAFWYWLLWRLRVIRNPQGWKLF